MGCQNCTPSKGDDGSKSFHRENKVANNSNIKPPADYQPDKPNQSTLSRDSFDKLFKKTLQPYQTKVIHFTQNHETESNNQSTDGGTVHSLDTSLFDLKVAAGALPLNTGSSIFVFINQGDPSMLKAIVTGPAYTPYAHGLFEFDIVLSDNPNIAHEVRFRTTGNNSVNFSAYLPVSGTVDMSCINNTPFSANEKKGTSSNLSQLLLSLQNLLRASAIFGVKEDQDGDNLTLDSPEGMREYKAYCNVIRYATIQYAMLEYLKNPPAELKEFIETYFYLKKDLILNECSKWTAEAQVDDGLYDTIVSKQNPEIAKELRNGASFVRMNEVVKSLEDELSNLPHNDFNPTMESLRKKTLKGSLTPVAF